MMSRTAILERKKKKMTPPVPKRKRKPKRKEPILYTLSTVQDVRDVITDFKETLKKAKGGGGHTVWRKIGDQQIGFRIHLPFKECYN